MIKLSSENAFSGIIYRLLMERQIILLPIFNPQYVVKCAAESLKITQQIKYLCLKVILNREFAWAREISLLEHLMLISSFFDKIFRHLKFSGKMVTSPACHFTKFPIQKYFWTKYFYFSTDFQNFCCTFYNKFRSRYMQENILSSTK